MNLAIVKANWCEPHTGRSFIGRIVHAQKTTTKIGNYMYVVDYTRNSWYHLLKIHKRIRKLLLMIVHAQKLRQTLENLHVRR